MVEPTSLAWEIAKPVTTWILVVLGWVVLADQQEQREAKKDGIARLARLREQLACAHQRVEQFHMNVYSADEQVGIQADLSDLGHVCDFLERAKFLNAGWTTGLRKFRQAATNENFDMSVHSALIRSNPLIAEIAASFLRIDRYLSQAEFYALKKPVTIWGSVARILRINRFVAWLDERSRQAAEKTDEI